MARVKMAERSSDFIWGLSSFSGVRPLDNAVCLSKAREEYSSGLAVYKRSFSTGVDNRGGILLPKAIKTVGKCLFATSTSILSWS